MDVTKGEGAYRTSYDLASLTKSLAMNLAQLCLVYVTSWVAWRYGSRLANA